MAHPLIHQRLLQELQQAHVAVETSTWEATTPATLVELLLSQGAPAEAIMGALSRASGLPRATADVWTPLPAGTEGQQAFERFWQVRGVPVGLQGDAWNVAFADPECAAGALAGPPLPLRAFLVTPAEFREALAHFIPAASGVASTPPAVAQARTARLAETEVATVALGSALEGNLADSAPELDAGRFVVERKLGAGGMAEVYLATDRVTGGRVALKTIIGPLASDAGFIQRFLREAHHASALSHPNIVGAIAHGRYQGHWCLVCEFLDGGTVQDLLRTVGPLPSDLAALVAEGLLRALEEAHRHGVVHRDVKPANLLLGSGGAIKLGDFGVAKGQADVTLTATAGLVGTPAYMSPEQTRGEPVDARGDLFSAGTTLYELLLGTNPFIVADNLGATFQRVASADAPPLSQKVPTAHPRLDSLLHGLLRPLPEARFPSATAALQVLQPLCDEIRARQPDLLAQCLRDPPGTVAALRLQQAQREFERGRRDWTVRPVSAALSVHRASLLQPQDAHIQEVLAQVCASTGVRFGMANDPRIDEACATAEKLPTAAGPQKRAADLLRAAGHVLASTHYLRRYLALKPQDSMALMQLTEALGPELTPPHLVATGVVASGVTRALMDGIKTGGFVASPPSASTAGGQVLVPLPIPSTDEPPPPLAEQLRDFWVAHRRRLVVSGVLLVAGFLAVRATGAFIDRSVEKTKQGLKDTTDRVTEGNGSIYGR